MLRPVIATARLDLLPGTPERLRAERRGAAELAVALDAAVPPAWPPDLYDRAAVEWSLAAHATPPGPGSYSSYYFVLREGDDGRRIAVGVGGFKGRPDADGNVEVGYSVLADHQRCGIATEAVGGLLQHAFADPAVARVLAETLPELKVSIAVLRKHGFAFLGDGSEPGVIRFALERP